MRDIRGQQLCDRPAHTDAATRDDGDLPLQIHGSLLLKIECDLCAASGGRCAMCCPQVIKSRKLMRDDGNNTVKYQDKHDGLRTLPRNALESVKS